MHSAVIMVAGLLHRTCRRLRAWRTMQTLLVARTIMIIVGRAALARVSVL